MKKNIIFLIVPALMLAMSSFSGCENNKNNSIDTELLYKKWKLVAFVNESDGTSRVPQPNSPDNYWVKFNIDNTLTGISSTNDLSGTFEIDNNNTIQIINLEGTEINEFGDGRLFVESLSLLQHFSVTEMELKLYYSENEYLLFNLTFASLLNH